jgi:hypothetical protein
VDLGDLPSWLALGGAIIVALLLVVPPLWVSADVDPTWQVQAHVRCLRPWTRKITMLEAIDGLPSRFDRWVNRRHVEVRVLSKRASELKPESSVEGLGNVETSVIDLDEPPPGTTVALVVKCGYRSHYCRPRCVDHPFHYDIA